MFPQIGPQFSKPPHSLSSEHGQGQTLPVPFSQQGAEPRLSGLRAASSSSAPPRRALRVADVLYAHRRPVPNEEGGVVTQENYSPDLLRRIDDFMTGNHPIRMAIPAFPFKSESPWKTLGDRGAKNPDRAEFISLLHLLGICEKIERKYSPGATITVYSDGGVFADTNRPEYTDDSRLRYVAKLREMIGSLGASDVVTIKDTEGEIARDIWDNYSEPVESIKSRMKIDPNLQLLYNGQHRFYTEEQVALNPELSRSQASKRAGKKAYEITQGSAALSKYLDVNDPEAVRISCHPKEMGTDKIGIWMDKGMSKVSPWQGAAALMVRPKTYSIMHVKDAEKSGLTLVRDEQGKPSHFERPEE
jgi:pyoverdine/dityrosine biosynthesis protein Dit1